MPLNRQESNTINTVARQAVWLRVAGWTAGVIAVLLLTGLIGSYTAYARWEKSGRIASNVIIHGQPVGGLTRGEASRQLEDRFGRLFVTITTPARPYRLSLKQLGGELQIDNVVNLTHSYGRAGSLPENMLQLIQARNREHRLSLPVRWDKEQLKKTMWTVAFDYQRPVRDAELRIGQSGVQVVGHQEGRTLNVGETLLNLQKQYYPGVDEIAATTRAVMPHITAESLAGRDVLLGSYPTYFNASLSGRTRNIRVAAAALEGRVLMPGDEFSFNRSTGKRTWEKGYRMAHIFERKPGDLKAEVVDGLAGGVCQVSSTLYNAVRRANAKTSAQLRIIERNHHSLPVNYVPSGLDATVAWPSLDFRFRNTFPHPVYIRTSVGGSRLTIEIWGRVPGDVGTVTVGDTSPKSALPGAKTGASQSS